MRAKPSNVRLDGDYLEVIHRDGSFERFNLRTGKLEVSHQSQFGTAAFVALYVGPPLILMLSALAFFR